MKWMCAFEMLTCSSWWLLSLVRCTELFFAFCREKNNNKNLWLFKKCWKKNCLEKKICFFIGAPIHCVYKLLWILTKEMLVFVLFSPHSHTEVIAQLVSSSFHYLLLNWQYCLKVFPRTTPNIDQNYFQYLNSWN